MFNRFHPVSTGWVLTLGLLPVAFSALVPLRADDRVRLGTEVLIGSRGKNPDNVLWQNLCALENNFFLCIVNDTDCTACSVETFTDTIDGTNGGYTIKGNNTVCGKVLNGTCQNLECDTEGSDPTGQCFNPTVIVQQ